MVMRCGWPISPAAPLIMAGKAFAGQPYQGEWPAGHCVRIMTGARYRPGRMRW